MITSTPKQREESNMTKAELAKEYLQLWYLTNKEIEYIRDTDSITGDRLYHRFFINKDEFPELSNRPELYALGADKWRLNRITKSDLAIKIQEITDQLSFLCKLLKQQLEKI
jgi:hypothetical protein